MAINACNQFLSVYAVLWASFIWNVKGLKCTPITYTHSHRETFDRKVYAYSISQIKCDIFLFSIHFNFKSLRSPHPLCTNFQLNCVSATVYIRAKSFITRFLVDNLYRIYFCFLETFNEKVNAIFILFVKHRYRFRSFSHGLKIALNEKKQQIGYIWWITKRTTTTALVLRINHFSNFFSTEIQKWFLICLVFFFFTKFHTLSKE